MISKDARYSILKPLSHALRARRSRQVKTALSLSLSIYLQYNLTLCAGRDYPLTNEWNGIRVGVVEIGFIDRDGFEWMVGIWKEAVRLRWIYVCCYGFVTAFALDTRSKKKTGALGALYHAHFFTHHAILVRRQYILHLTLSPSLPHFLPSGPAPSSALHLPIHPSIHISTTSIPSLS